MYFTTFLISLSDEAAFQRQSRIFRLPETPVAFSAFINSGPPEVNNHQNIVFDLTHVNEGNGYHSSAGLFIAPITGLYFFTVTLTHPEQPQPAHVNILKNGIVVARVHAERHTWEQSSQSVILNLSVGDEVFIRSEDFDHEHFAGVLSSSFSGFLLWTA